MKSCKVRMLQLIVVMLLVVNVSLVSKLLASPGESTTPKVRTITAKLTGYCPCEKCCGSWADGVTSTGRSAKLPGAAVDPKMIPYRSMLVIPGVGKRLADDTGGAMRQAGRRGEYHIDVRFRTHKEALRFGVRHNVEVQVYEPAGK